MSVDLQGLETDVLNSLSMLSDNTEWIGKMDGYFTNNPEVLDKAFTDCQSYVQTAKDKYKVDQMDVYNQLWIKMQENIINISNFMQVLNAFTLEMQWKNQNMVEYLQRRDYLQGKGSLTPQKKAEIWSKIIQDSTVNLAYQVSQLKLLNNNLSELSKACEKSTQDLNSMVNHVVSKLNDKWFVINFESKFDYLITHIKVVDPKSLDTYEAPKSMDTDPKSNDLTQEQIDEMLSKVDFSDKF